MKSRYLIGPLVTDVSATTMTEAGAGIRDALANGTHARTIRLWLNPNSPELGPWLDAAKVATPEIRGMMVQGFFARACSKAGYEVMVGKELDVSARSPFRTLLIEVKSSLAGGKFGSQAVLSQLDGYSRVSGGRGAEIWLGVMGIKSPIFLSLALRAEIQNRNIGLLEARWISPRDTLLPHLSISNLA